MEKIIGYLKEKQREYEYGSHIYNVLRNLEVVLPNMISESREEEIRLLKEENAELTRQRDRYWNEKQDQARSISELQSELNSLRANPKTTDEEIEKWIEIELNELPYTKHVDDGQYNDGRLTGFEEGARSISKWMRDRMSDNPSQE